jgi:hypothetical protein
MGFSKIIDEVWSKNPPREVPPPVSNAGGGHLFHRGHSLTHPFDSLTLYWIYLNRSKVEEKANPKMISIYLKSDPITAFSV